MIKHAADEIAVSGESAALQSRQTPIIRMRGLTVHYRQACALRDVDLDIEAGAVTAIVGPSGCGKSTLLSCLNRLTDLTSYCRVTGNITFDGSDVLAPSCDVLALRRRVGMVFQKPNPFPLSIRRNFTLPLKQHGLRRRDEMEAVIERSLRAVGLWAEVKDRLDRGATQLSGGQQQRLCIARALALDPDVILFDEPCSALDPLASRVVEEHIASLRGSVTVVIVTHNLPQANRMADTVALFWTEKEVGRLIEHGPREQIFENPKHEITAAYVGGNLG